MASFLATLIKDKNVSWNFVTQLHSIIRKSSSTSTIQIPNRIHREPTDILKALESTIQRDPTGMHYKYMDDPFLLPHSNSTKRTYALSRESGKKAALWIRSQHSDLFQHREADPMIEAFIPKMVFTEKSQVSEELLLNTIRQAQVEESMHIYKLLDRDVSDKAKLALLELLCFYNSKEAENTEFLESKWLQNAEDARELWKKNIEVDKLFAHLSNQGPDIAGPAYNAMIAAYAKYSKVEHAEVLVKQCEENGHSLNLNAYNELISLVVMQAADPGIRWELIKGLLTKMKINNVTPNIQTLNACLKVMSTTYSDRSLDVIRTLVSDFKQNGISPCLAIQVVHVALQQIMDEVEKMGELEIRDPKDTYFFIFAMSVARQSMDLSLGERIHKILLHKKNYRFIGDGLKENIYYRHYTLLWLATKPLKEFYTLYSKLVPNVYIPEGLVINEILATMSNNPPENVTDLIPTVWSQIVMFNYTSNENIVKALFDVMYNISILVPNDEQLIKEHSLIAWKYFELIQETFKFKRNRSNTSVHAEVLGNVLILLTRNKMFDEVLQVFEFIQKNYNYITDDISESKLKSLLQEFISNNQVDAAFCALKYGIDCNYTDFALEGQNMKSLPMTPKEKGLLVSLIGSQTAETLEESENKNA